MEKYWIFVFLATVWAFHLILTTDCVSIVSVGSTCNSTGLTCGQNQYVRCQKTGCDNNTCTSALSGPRPCAQFIALVPAYCDCVSGYYKDAAGNCVTRQQCQEESS